MTKRKIICADALEWLPENRNLGSIVTSLPDMHETGHTNETEYFEWFKKAVKQCFNSVSVGHPVIFYQTDRLFNGRRLSKAFELMEVADWTQIYELVWHKIVLRRDAGKTDIRRPGYSHLLCFGDPYVKPGRPTPDVMHTGGVLYPDGIGLTPTKVALQHVLLHGKAICDPFCGRGTVLAVAEAMGFDKIIGIDIDEKQCAAARALKIYKGVFK